MWKKILLPGIVLCILLLTFIAIRDKSHESLLSLVATKSYLNDWYVDDDCVYFDCHLVMQSKDDVDATFQVTAFSEVDFQNGLIATAELKCVEQQLHFEASSKEATFDLRFVAPHGEYSVKADRLLPAIIVIHSVRPKQ